MLAFALVLVAGCAQQAPTDQYGATQTTETPVITQEPTQQVTEPVITQQPTETQQPAVTQPTTTQKTVTTPKTTTVQPVTKPQTVAPKPVKKTVTILNFAFTPQDLTIKAGTTVTWVNNDSAAHKLALSSGDASGFGSANLANGQTYSYTFTKTGTVNYFCQIHPMMKGTITVTP